MSIRVNKPDRNKCYPTYMGNDDMSSCPLIRLDEEAASLKLQDDAAKKARKRQHEDAGQRNQRNPASKRHIQAEAVISNPATMANVPANNARAPVIQGEKVIPGNKKKTNMNAASSQADPRVYELEVENFQLQQEIFQLKQSLDEKSKDLAHMTKQRDNETFRADKLEQDLMFLQKQNMNLLRENSKVQSTRTSSFENKILQTELDAIKQENASLHEQNKAIKDQLVQLQINGSSNNSPSSTPPIDLTNDPRYQFLKQQAE